MHGIATTGFRFFNICGPRQDPCSPYSGVISIFAERLASGRTATIYGDGLQVRDFVYVADCVRFVIAGMEKTSTEAEVFNVCTGKSASLLDLVGAMSQGGLALAVEHGPARVGDIRTSYGDPSRAEAAFGIKAGTTLQDGLALLIDSLNR